MEIFCFPALYVRDSVSQNLFNVLLQYNPEFKLETLTSCKNLCFLFLFLPTLTEIIKLFNAISNYFVVIPVNLLMWLKQLHRINSSGQMFFIL